MPQAQKILGCFFATIILFCSYRCLAPDREETIELLRSKKRGRDENLPKQKLSEREFAQVKFADHLVESGPILILQVH